MAEKNKQSKAERAVSAAKSKSKAAKAKKEPPVEPTDNGTKASQLAYQLSMKDEPNMPARLLGAVLCLILFVVFLVIVLKPEGALLKLIERVLVSLVGRACFLFLIPAMLYLFFILALSGTRPVRMRTICTILFALTCGCIAHMMLNPQDLPKGFALVGALYKGGYLGTTGGLICGSVTMLIRWLCGTTIAYIFFFVAAFLLLLGAMQITVPSIIRAIQNRPRAEWEEEKRAEKPEPAAVVVNHIVTKRIEHAQQRRNREEEKAKTQNKQLPESTATSERASNLMRQIEGDTWAPVVAASDSMEEKLPLPKRKSKKKAAREQENTEITLIPKKTEANVDDVPVEMPKFRQDDPIPPAPQIVKPRKVTAKEADESAMQVAAEIAMSASEEIPEYGFPPIDLLNEPDESGADGTLEMRENSRRLNETLESFKIEAHIINVTRGPSVTRYEVELEKGVRLSKLTTAADDIALNLGATGVRIAAIPGKISVVGIEVPNRDVTKVFLREVIDSNEFIKAKSKSSFAVGKDIGGNCIVGNIAKLPHMLIAGTTGSGKSVCMNSLIVSLLYKASPDDVKLIMIDPKMVELGVYNGIPHLLIPVVTDPKKAAGSLQWAVSEMMRRYQAMSNMGVRDIASYNNIIQREGGAKLPQIVVIIDELADLMLVAAKEVEESICRIAQMGRASGMHLVIATQRPSADVITGLMKANIPSRIAFAVSSAMESRIILDTQGAEKLVGRGDMLFAPIGSGKPRRVQGCFVTDEEVEAVASYVKENYSSTYDHNIMEEIEKKAAQTGNKGNAPAETEPSAEELGGDEMLPAAVDVILETGQASVSMLQRRLKLGYARAARIVDEMEERGIVGPFQGSKPRTILVTKEQWEQMRNGQNVQMVFDDLDQPADDTLDDMNE